MQGKPKWCGSGHNVVGDAGTEQERTLSVCTAACVAAAMQFSCTWVPSKSVGMLFSRSSICTALLDVSWSSFWDAGLQSHHVAARCARLNRTQPANWQTQANPRRPHFQL